MKIYIAGKVTGENYNDCLEKFANAKKRLEKHNLKAVNPMDIVPRNTEWVQAMRICVSALAQCDGAYFLCGYEKSKGALLEHTIAKLLRIPTFYEGLHDAETISERISSKSQADTRKQIHCVSCNGNACRENAHCSGDVQTNERT